MAAPGASSALRAVWRTGPTQLEVHSSPLADLTLRSIEKEWRALEATATPHPYLTMGWLKSWIAVYEPRRLSVLRVVDRDHGTAGLGVVEELSLRRMRFAGAPVTPVRGLLCRGDHELEVWRGVARWLRVARPRRTCLGATGVDAHHGQIPGAITTALPWFSLELPGTFDEYVAGLSSPTRREARRRLRVAEREGAIASTLAPESAAAGLEAFVRLHRARAEAKGELHPSIDERLLKMLQSVAQYGQPELRVTVLEQRGRTLAAAVWLCQDDLCWFYNTGFDPAAARLSPGMLVQMASIREAIGRGARRCDLGQGDYAYKRTLGGTPLQRLKIDVTSPSTAGRILRAALVSREHAERAPRLRAAALAARRTLHLRDEP